MNVACCLYAIFISHHISGSLFQSYLHISNSKICFLCQHDPLLFPANLQVKVNLCSILSLSEWSHNAKRLNHIITLVVRLLFNPWTIFNNYLSPALDLWHSILFFVDQINWTNVVMPLICCQIHISRSKWSILMALY